MAATFAAATAINTVDSHTYNAHLHEEWAVGSVPHGGYVASTLMKVATRHFSSTLAAQNQPHTATMHIEYLRRTRAGSATFKVRDVKLGRQTSSIHVTLIQENQEVVVSYITNLNMHLEDGPSAPTGWSLEPPPLPVDLLRLDANTDPNWKRQSVDGLPKIRRVAFLVDQYLPRTPLAISSICDEWLRLSSGERFTNESLGFVADYFPLIMEQIQRREDPGSASKMPYWHPTLVLNLDVKKALPSDGVEWLFVRARAKRIQRGRQDFEIIILDAQGDVVALSHHVALVLDFSRNIAERGASKKL